MARPNQASTINPPPKPTIPGTSKPKCTTSREVVTVNIVVAVPLTGVMDGGLKAQLMPIVDEHENVTGAAKPPAGVNVSWNCADCPAITIALEGVTASEKSALAMSIATAAESLEPNFASPP